MPIEKISEGLWRIRLRYGKGLRGRFTILAKSQAAAEVRAARMTKMAGDLADCGKNAEAKAVLDEAGEAETERELLDIEDVVRQLCSEAPAGAPRAREPRTFADVADMWLSGELHSKWPDDVPVKGADSTAQDRGSIAVINTVLGRMPVDKVTLDDAERAKALATARSARRRYSILIRRVMALAEYPLRLIERSPIPPKFVPAEGRPRAFGFLYPSEDAQVLACPDIPFDDRLFYGFVTRNGCRVSEAARLVWGDISLSLGTVVLDKNKTKTPRTWAMSPDVVRALAAYRGDATDEDVVFPMFVMRHVARRFRRHLGLAGVDRRDLHALTKERRPIRFHDLRATFITLALANGRTETWVMDRTGHTTSAMLNKYRRQARFASELGLGWLSDLDDALGMGHAMGQEIDIPRENAGDDHLRYGKVENRTGPEEERPEPVSAVPDPSRVSGDTTGPTGNTGVGHDPVELALSKALESATRAGRWDVVLAVTAELSARRRERGGQ